MVGSSKRQYTPPWATVVESVPAVSLCWDKTEHLDKQSERTERMIQARGNTKNDSIKAEKPKSCSGDYEWTVLEKER